MSRRPKQTFACRALADLTRQLLFAPAEKRIEQVRRAERLHDQIEPGRNYPFEFLQFRITGYRGESTEPTVVVGAAALADLRLMIDSLSHSVGVPQSPDDPVESGSQLAARLKVTTRTIARWRKLGLRWRWMAPGPGKPARLGIPRQAVERFLRDQAGRVARAGRFTRIPEAARQRLVERARRIVLAREVSLNRVAAHLARRTGRALETIRQLLERHDRKNPRRAIFADRSGPLNAQQKRLIARAHHVGLPISRLARRFNKTHSTIYRAVRERRATELRKLTITFVPSPLFAHPDADALILTPPPEVHSEVFPGTHDETVADPGLRTDDLPTPLDRLYRRPPLNPALERGLFVRYNYVKFKAARLRESLERYEPRVGDMDQIDDLVNQSRLMRNQLVRAHLRQVLSVARRHLTDQSDASTAHLAALLLLGNQTLIDAVDQFDPARGQTFESFLTFQLQRRFVQALSLTRAHRRPEGRVVYDQLIAEARALGVDLAGE